MSDEPGKKNESPFFWPWPKATRVMASVGIILVVAMVIREARRSPLVLPTPVVAEVAKETPPAVSEPASPVVSTITPVSPSPALVEVVPVPLSIPSKPKHVHKRAPVPAATVAASTVTAQSAVSTNTLPATPVVLPVASTAPATQPSSGPLTAPATASSAVPVDK